MESDSELGPLLAGLSQHAWGSCSEGLLRVREPCVPVTPVHTCTRPGLPLAARALCWKSGLLVMVCGGGSVDTGPPLIPWEPVQGACATRSFRAPGSQRPLHLATPSAAHLGLPWLRVSRSCCRAGHGGQGAPWVTFAPCLLPTQIYTIFLKTEFDTACMYLFLFAFCLIFT